MCMLRHCACMHKNEYREFLVQGLSLAKVQIVQISKAVHDLEARLCFQSRRAEGPHTALANVML
jgi:hypothetical protein